MKKLLSYISLVLVISLLANILHIGVFAEQFQDSIVNTETTTKEPTTEEVIPEDAYVVAEIEKKRTEYSKEFLLSNGLHMAIVYPDSVHYAAKSGWEEIDNTLKTNANGTYTNTAGLWNVTFPEQLDKDKSVSIEKDGYTLSFFISGELTIRDATAMSVGLEEAPLQMFATTQAQPTTGQIQQIDTSAMKEAAAFPETVPDKLQSQIAYADVYENTDIIYDLASNKVKESMILESYDSSLQGYRYTLEVGAMIPVLEEDGSVTLYDQNRENIIMVMPVPYLIDNSGKHNYDIEVQLFGKGSTYTLIYLLPQTWLAEEDRAWPVVLDPIVLPSLTTTNIRDRTVAQNKTYDQSWGMNTCGYDTDTGIMRFYLKYQNLPNLTSSESVVGATIKMYKPNASSTTTPVYVHKVNSIWDSSTITWANKPGFNSTIEDYAIVNDVNWYEWVITDIVQDWYANENTGMLFKASDAIENGGTANFKQFYSSDYGTENTRPLLIIYFRNNSGLENYWDFTPSSAGRAGTGYVNNYTGNLTWVREDMGFGGNRMPVTISHIYNANDMANNTFLVGAGWRTNYHQLIYRYNNNSNYYVWEDGDGTKHYFAHDTGNTYIHEDDPQLVLTDGGTGTEKYCITNKDGVCSYFDTYGRLTKISDDQQTSNSINLTYTSTSGKGISTIRDGIGRLYRFFYNTNGNLSYIAYRGTGNTNLHNTIYGYEGNQLTSVTDHDNKITYFAYSNGLLTDATAPDGYKLHYTYITPLSGNTWQPYRVHSVASYDDNTPGGTLTFTYTHNQTKVTDYNNNTEVYQFNDFGNTISIQDNTGHAQFAQFAKTTKDDTTGKANQLTKASKLQNTVGNRYKDSSFEYQTAWRPNGANVTAAATADTAYYGTYSQKIVNTAYAKNSTAYSANFLVKKGETVTASAYIKNPDAATTLELHYYNSEISSYVNIASPSVPATNGWTRTEVTFTNPHQSGIYVYVHLRVENPGTYYVDCVQVEAAASASRYNLIENGDFIHGEFGWTRGTYFNSSDTHTTVTAGSQAAPQLGEVVYRVTGDTEKGKHLWQRLNVSGDAGDCYVFAGWAKADSAPIPKNSNRRFALTAYFQNDDGTTTQRLLAFNTDVGTENDWQYLAGAVIADKPYHAIHLNAQYDYNINTVYYDGIQFFKEEFCASYTYDSKGNLISVTDLQNQVTEYEYDSESNLTKVILNGNTEMTYEYYPDSHNIKTATTKEGLIYNFTYDTYGNNTSVSITADSMTMKSEAYYTANGNYLDYAKDALGKTTDYQYDENTGVLNWVQYPEDTEATRTTYTYDSMYRTATAACTTDTGLNLSAAYTYTDDLLTTITTPSTTYNFTYGDFNLRTGVSIGDRTLASYHYTEEAINDRKYDLDRLDYGNGDNVQYEYDDKGRIIRQVYEDEAFVTYAYDNDGNLAKVYDSQSGITTAYYYDLSGRMMQYVESGTGHSLSVVYTYDTRNNLTQTVETVNGTSTTTVYTYDDDNRVTSSSASGTTVEYTYDNLGRVLKQTTKRGSTVILTEHYTYTAPTTTTTSAQVATYSTVAGQTTVGYSYTYDDNGNIVSINDGTNTTSYVYDSANQLIRENNQAGDFTHTWTYDNAGNILSRKEYANTTGSLESVTPSDTVTYTYGDEDWGDLLTSYDGSTITYDEIGNPLTDGTWTYTWQHGRQLVSMRKGATAAWYYTYDANGMRTSRTNGTTTYNYVYDGSLLKELTVGANTLRFTYDASGTPLTVTFNGTTYYYVTNLQGDVTAILTQARNPVVNYTYDAWGNILTFSGSLATTLGRYNPLTYRGYVYDQETGLYYLQSRYYDPEIGRWINVDSQLNTSLGMLGYNMFAYCLNNPSNMADFGGNKPGDLFDTMNEAARDAAIYLGSLSFENCWEYMTVIHSVTKLKVTCTPVTKTCRFLWWSWTTTSLKITITTTTKYTYCTIYTDRSPKFVNIPLEAYFKSSLATVHTHPLGSGRGATQFSPGDYETANDMGLIDYVHGPNGKLKKYDPSTGEEIFVFTDLPKSPKKPWLK